MGDGEYCVFVCVCMLGFWVVVVEVEVGEVIWYELVLDLVVVVLVVWVGDVGV